MTEYSVEITDAAFVAIRDHARHVAIELAAPENAKRWLQRVRDAIDSLQRWPRRAPKAPEDAFVPYEVRQLVLENHLLLFTIDDEQRKVWILGLRHGARLPRPQDLPPVPPSADTEADDE